MNTERLANELKYELLKKVLPEYLQSVTNTMQKAVDLVIMMAKIREAATEMIPDHAGEEPAPEEVKKFDDLCIAVELARLTIEEACNRNGIEV